MKYDNFLRVIKNFKNGLVSEVNGYIPLIVVEQVLKKR